MTAVPILGALLAAVLWWYRHQARKARDEAAQERTKREQAEGELAVAHVEAEVTAAVHVGQADGEVSARRVEEKAREAEAAGDPHPERAAARERVKRQEEAAAKLRRIVATRRKGGR